MRIASVGMVNKILNSNGLHAKKGYGQNFIIDSNIIDKIVEKAGVDDQTGVIEIGPGIGSLTEGLLLKAKKVLALEIDQNLIPILNENFKNYNNFSLINRDFLKIDLNKLVDEEFNDFDKVIIVSNLPYYITTPILTKVFESNSRIQSITVMVQKEVADRITFVKGAEEYKVLDVLASYYSDAEIVMQISRTIFMPQPNVDSAVVKFTMNKKNKDLKNEKLFIEIIKSSFSQRRKKLINNLEKYGKEKVKIILGKLGLNENVRAEELNLEDFVKISNLLNEK